jgi:hypothetical protein
MTAPNTTPASTTSSHEPAPQVAGTSASQPPRPGQKRLGLLYGGSLPEYKVISDARFNPWLAKTIYLPECSEESLADLDGLYVPEGSNHRRLQEVAGMVRAFLERGKTVLLFGDQPVAWLPGIAWEFRPALAAPKLTPGPVDHGFLGATPPLDQIWHHHGVLRAPAGADTILSTEDGAGVLYVDRVSTGGTILVTTLDPLRHTGETASPQPSRFLECFLPWVVNDLL